MTTAISDAEMPRLRAASHSSSLAVGISRAGARSVVEITCEPFERRVPGIGPQALAVVVVGGLAVAVPDADPPAAPDADGVADAAVARPRSTGGLLGRVA